ncbi:hypothetical protein Hanom_Chr01g00055431 [Helianthus anomalus]
MYLFSPKDLLKPSFVSFKINDGKLFFYKLSSTNGWIAFSKRRLTDSPHVPPLWIRTCWSQRLAFFR